MIMDNFVNLFSFTEVEDSGSKIQSRWLRQRTNSFHSDSGSDSVSTLNLLQKDASTEISDFSKDNISKKKTVFATTISIALFAVISGIWFFYLTEYFDTAGSVVVVAETAAGLETPLAQIGKSGMTKADTTNGLERPAGSVFPPNIIGQDRTPQPGLLPSKDAGANAAEKTELKCEKIRYLATFDDLFIRERMSRPDWHRYNSVRDLPSRPFLFSALKEANRRDYLSKEKIPKPAILRLGNRPEMDYAISKVSEKSKPIIYKPKDQSLKLKIDVTEIRLTLAENCGIDLNENLGILYFNEDVIKSPESETVKTKTLKFQRKTYGMPIESSSKEPIGLPIEVKIHFNVDLFKRFSSPVRKLFFTNLEEHNEEPSKSSLTGYMATVAIKGNQIIFRVTKDLTSLAKSVILNFEEDAQNFLAQKVFAKFMTRKSAYFAISPESSDRTTRWADEESLQLMLGAQPDVAGIRVGNNHPVVKIWKMPDQFKLKKLVPVVEVKGKTTYALMQPVDRPDVPSSSEEPKEKSYEHLKLEGYVWLRNLPVYLTILDEVKYSLLFFRKENEAPKTVVRSPEQVTPTATTATITESEQTATTASADEQARRAEDIITAHSPEEVIPEAAPAASTTEQMQREENRQEPSYQVWNGGMPFWLGTGRYADKDENEHMETFFRNRMRAAEYEAMAGRAAAKAMNIRLGFIEPQRTLDFDP